jgi:hypothetical protein
VSVARPVVLLAALTLGAMGCSDGADQSTTSAPPPSTAAPATTTAPATPASADQGADLDEFVLRFVAALQEGDVDSIADVIHPAALQIYGADRCREHVTGLDPVPIEITPERPGPSGLDVERDGHVLTLSGWTASLDAAGTELFPGGFVIAEDAGRLAWVPDCGRVLVTADPGGLTIVTIVGDSRSVPFDAPDSWRIEAASSGPCQVILHEEVAGTSQSIGSGDTSFVVQRGGSGRYSVEAIGCRHVSVIENSAET